VPFGDTIILRRNSMDTVHSTIELLEDGMPRILPPSENGVFQAVLTLPEANAALVSAISAFIDRPVRSVMLRQNVLPSRDIAAKQEEHDINCVVDGEDGDQCGVEMQAHKMEGDNLGNDHRNAKWRSIFNLCDLHSNQPGRGKRYGDYSRSYQVMVCNYRAFTAGSRLVERYTMRTPEGTELCDAITAVFIDLTKAEGIASKPVCEMADIEQWAVFFALADDPAYRRVISEIAKTKEGIAVANETLQQISQNPDERARYRSRRIALLDREHDLAAARADVREEYEPIIAQKDVEIADKVAKIAGKDAEIAGKDAEIEALRAQLKSQSTSED